MLDGVEPHSRTVLVLKMQDTDVPAELHAELIGLAAALRQCGRSFECIAKPVHEWDADQSSAAQAAASRLLLDGRS